MEVDTDEDLLHTLAAGGSIDYDLWPRLLRTIVSRIETIVYHEFPTPVIPPPRRTQSRLPDWVPPKPVPSTSNGTGSSPKATAAGPLSGRGPSPQEDTNKENTDPVPLDAAAASSSGRSGGGDNGNGGDEAAVAPGTASAPSPGAEPTMPQQAVESINYIISSLTNNFAKYPPHSIQRLAELVIAPHQHYRYLGPYLHALDRVVSVTSFSNVYPLPPAVPDRAAMTILANGATPSAAGSLENGDILDTNGNITGLSLAANPAGDNSLGALLTPIPWLRRHPAGGGDDSTTEEGSSPPSSTDGSDIAFSTTSSVAGGSVRGAPSAPQAPSASSLHQQQPAQPQQRRMEVHSEATETIDGPNGMGSIETVSVSINGIPSHGAMAAAVQLQQQRGITQGELLRQEQKAGVVPVSQLARAAAARAAVGGPGGGRYGDRFEGHEDDDDEEDDVEDDDDNEMEDHGGRRPFPDDGSSAARINDPDTAMGGTADIATGNADDINIKTTTATTTADTGAGSANDNRHGDDAGMAKAGDDEEEEIPHARGPQEIGATDMGPQRVTSSTSTGMLIGSAAEASEVDINDMSLETAVGRKASDLPAGTVAAPLVPSVAAAAAADADTVAEAEAKGKDAGVKDTEIKDADEPAIS